MSISSNKYGAINPLELNKHIKEMTERTNEYKNLDGLSSFKEFLNHDKDMVKEIMYNNSVPKNSEIINYMFVEDNCFYNDKMIKDIVDFGIENNNIKILETVKIRHPEFLDINALYSLEMEKETFEFFKDNTDIFENTSDYQKTIIATSLIDKKEFDKLDSLEGFREHILQHSEKLTLESMKGFIEHYKLSNEGMKKLFISSFIEKGDCGDENINIFVEKNDFTLKEVINEKGGYGDNLLNEKIKYLNKTYSFDKITLQEAFDKSIDNYNLECAKTLLETNQFKPKVSTLIKIEKQFPEFHNYCKKYIMTQDLDNKLNYKKTTPKVSHSLKI